MATTAYYKDGVVQTATVPASVRVLDVSNLSNNSLRVNGKLVLKPQVHSFARDQLKRFSFGVLDSRKVLSYSPPQSASLGRTDATPPGFSTVTNDNRALARYYGKLHYGGASLGITIAQWGQANSMILSRFGKIAKLLGNAEVRLRRDLRTRKGRQRFKRDRLNPKRNRAVTRDPLASQVLEFEFGWAPLVQDALAVTQTLFKHAIPNSYVRASSTSYDEKVVDDVPGAYERRKRTWLYRSNTTISAVVAIQNPNLWLANRAGLINLPGIVWDAIPWSFLVGQFVNVNQLLSQFTNEVGLSFKDRSTTKSLKAVHVQTRTTWSRNPQDSDNLGPACYSSTVLTYTTKTRQVGVFPSVSLQWRVPDITPEKLLIASALIVQRIRKIDKLIDAVAFATRKK